MASILESVQLAPFTYYKVGGPARYFFEAATRDEVREAVLFAQNKNLPFVVLGSGSNVLISDKGFKGLLIRLSLPDIQIDGTHVTAEAGVPMARVAAASVAESLAGIEWAIGIPGGLGGSVRGNAGCFGGSMSDIVGVVEVYDTSRDEIFVLPNETCGFGYRTSIFKSKPEWIVLSARLELVKGNMEESRARIKEYAEKRVISQAIGSKSAGCIFKNIEWSRPGIDRMALIRRFPELSLFTSFPGIPAAYCIDAVGLKGKRIGDVEISPKHANYFVNHGNAAAEDVVTLISVTKDRVRRKFGLNLEEEIQYIGF